MFKCLNGHETDTMPKDGLCPICKEPLMQVTEVQKAPEHKEIKPPQGNYGLAIFLLDVSPSMNDPMPGATPALRTKLDFVEHAVDKALEKLVSGASAIRKPENQYIVFVPFFGEAKISWIGSVKDIAKTVGNSNKFFRKLVLDRVNRGFGTNIREALEVAHSIYKSALDGTLGGKSFNGFRFPSDFQLTSQSVYVNATKDVVFVPNIRVFLYSDGGHNIGPFHNPFENEFILSGIKGMDGRLVNGLITLFFGPYDSDGAHLMKDIAGFCPQHETVGFLNIQEINLNTFSILRDLIHNTSRASGFCLQCIGEG